MPTSLIDKITEYKVSSVLNNDRKVYGKKFLFDRKDETCWNSDQGTPQWIHFSFEESVTLTGIKLQFQGGFAGRECELGILSNNDEHKQCSEETKEESSSVYQFSPEDINSLQEFSLQNTLKGSNFYLKFSSSTDFYGRIILYTFDILGEIP